MTKKKMINVPVFDNGGLKERITRCLNPGHYVAVFDHFQGETLCGFNEWNGNGKIVDRYKETVYGRKMELDNDFFRRMFSNDFEPNGYPTKPILSEECIEAYADEYDTLAPSLDTNDLDKQFIPQYSARIGMAISTTDAIRLADFDPVAAMNCFLPHGDKRLNIDEPDPVYLIDKNEPYV